MSEISERFIQLTRDLVLIESTHGKPDQLARCFQWIRNHLEQTPGLEIQMFEKNGFESLVALPTGVIRPEVLLCGHLDVVEHPDPEAYRTEVRDGKIFGPGAGDMKGQLVILLELMRRVHAKAPGASLGFVVTSDEEIGGENGLGFLAEEAGLRCGAAIIPDGGSISEITVEEKGILHLRLEVAGEPGHAARPWLGRNPLEILCDRLAVLRAAFRTMREECEALPEDGPHWFPTCAVTVIGTPNESPNRIPGDAFAVLDVRFPPGCGGAEMLGRVEELLGAGVKVIPLVMAEPTRLDPDAAFIEATREVTGEVKRVKASGGSDSRFLVAHGIPVMLSRPRVGNLHGRDEWIEVDSMRDYFRICCRYLEGRLGVELGED